MKEKTNRKQYKETAILVLVMMCLVVIGTVGLPFIGTVIWHYTTVSKHQEELHSYSPEIYEYLLEANNNIFKENECVIDINAIPEDIVMEKFEMKDNKFVCELRWDNGKNGKYIPVANITAEMSRNFEILSITSAYSSEENFVKAFKDNIQTREHDIFINIMSYELLIYILVAIILKYHNDIIKKCKKLFQPKK